jgi:hypothetical protein
MDHRLKLRSTSTNVQARLRRSLWHLARFGGRTGGNAAVSDEGKGWEMRSPFGSIARFAAILGGIGVLAACAGPAPSGESGVSRELLRS